MTDSPSNAKIVFEYILFIAVGFLTLWVGIETYKDTKSGLESYKRIEGYSAKIYKNGKNIIININGYSSDYIIFSPSKNLKRELFEINYDYIILYYKNSIDNKPHSIVQLEKNQKVIYPLVQWQKSERRGASLMIFAGLIFLYIGIRFCISFLIKQKKIRETCYPVR